MPTRSLDTNGEQHLFGQRVRLACVNGNQKEFAVAKKRTQHVQQKHNYASTVPSQQAKNHMTRTPTPSTQQQAVDNKKNENMKAGKHKYANTVPNQQAKKNLTRTPTTSTEQLAFDTKKFKHFSQQTQICQHNTKQASKEEHDENANNKLRGVTSWQQTNANMVAAHDTWQYKQQTLRSPTLPAPQTKTRFVWCSVLVLVPAATVFAARKVHSVAIDQKTSTQAKDS